jgi:hypothetical protein
VLNSDNINITGESFDYGPWRFTPFWDPNFTAAYFDHAGLYAFGRQPEAIHWDLQQLAGCLSLIAEPAALRHARSLERRFEQALAARCLRRLGVCPGEERESDRELLIRARGGRLRRSADDRPHLLRLARRPRSRRGAYPAEPSASSPGRSRRRERHPVHPYWSDPAPCSMHIDEVEAIWDGDRRKATTGSPFTTRLMPSSNGRGDDGAGCAGKLDRRKPGGEPRAMATRSFRPIPRPARIVWSGEIGDAAAEVAAARAAWPAWAAHSHRFPHRGAAPLRQCRAQEREGGFAELIARETGKPLWEARTEVGAVVNKVDISIDAYAERTPQRKLEAALGNRIAVRHKPHGVLAVLGPYNFPRTCPTATSSRR